MATAALPAAAQKRTLLETDLPNMRLVLDNLCLNGLHNLHKFNIRNTANTRILVKLRSNLGKQVNFQLANENFTDNGIAEGENFNQLFNYVNYVDELELAKDQNQDIIVAFLPEPKTIRSSSSMYNLNASSRLADGSFQAGVDETFEMQEVNGVISLYVFALEEQQEQVSASVNDQTSSAVSSNELVPARVQDFSDISKCDQQLSIKLRSKVCRSVMHADVGDTSLMFDNCVLGGTYSRDFTLWNRSEIDLHWSLLVTDLNNNAEMANRLEFTDCDTGDPLDMSPISSYSQVRIRVTFKPRLTGEFNYDLHLKNKNDYTNDISIKIHAVVRAVHRDETLWISSGNVLDFGDCYAGITTQQSITFRNISNKRIDLQFASDIPNQVFFELKQDVLRDLNVSEKSASEQPFVTSEDSSRASSPSQLLDSAENGRSLVNTTNESNDLSPSKAVSMRVEELSIPPGVARTVDVWYRPEKPPASAQDDKAARFNRRSFMLYIKFTGSVDSSQRAENKERKIIQAVARVCTSIIVVDPAVVNFGDTDVGRLKSSGFSVINKSDMPARVKLSYISKVLSAPREELVIPARQSIPVRLEIFPRKVNSDYCKQITVLNMLNHDNDQILDVRANNIDQHRITFHSLFYRIWTPSLQSFLDFGNLIANAPSVCTFSLENISNRDLVLELSTSQPDQMRIYLKREDAIACAFNPAGFASAITTLSKPSLTDADYQKEKDVFDDVPLSLTSPLFQRSVFSPPLSHGSGNSTNVASDQVPVFAEKRERLLESIEARQARSLRGANPPTSSNSPAMDSPNQISSTTASQRLKRATTPLDPNHVPASPSQGGTVGFSNGRSSRDSIEYLDLARLNGSGSSNRRNHQRILSLLSRGGGVASVSSSRNPRWTFSQDDDTNMLNGSSYNAETNASDEFPASNLFAWQDDQRLNSAQAIFPSSQTQNGANGNPVALSSFSSVVSPVGPAGQVPSQTAENTADHSGAEFALPPTIPTNMSAPTSNSNSTLPAIPLDTVLKQLQERSNIPSFPRQELEDQYVREHQALHRALEQAIKEGRLVPVSSVRVPTTGRLTVVIVATAISTTTRVKLKKQDAKLLIKLVEFARDIQTISTATTSAVSENEEIPVREVIIQAKVCRSIMDLGHKHINFGLLAKNERREKTILIKNLSEVPLIYRIRKTGSVASGDLIISDGKFGIVRPFGKREVNFVFEPTMAGVFQERLLLENLQDHNDKHTILVKATIRKASNFFINSLSIRFGPCLINEYAHYIPQLIVTNTSKQPRVFEMNMESALFKFESCDVRLVFEVNENLNGSKTVSKETEEQIESLDMKLKIAQRKGNLDKVTSLQMKIDQLRGALKGSSPLLAAPPASDGSTTISIPPTTSSTGPPTPVGDAPIDKFEVSVNRNSTVRKTDTSIVFSLDPQSSKTINVTMRPSRNSREPQTEPKEVSGSIVVHESKNTDEVKRVQWSAVVCFDFNSYMAALALTKEEEDTSPVSSSVVPSRAVSRSVSRRNSRDLSPAHSMGTVATPTSSQDGEPEIAFVVIPGRMDLGDVEVNKTMTGEIAIVNNRDVATDFEILDVESDATLSEADRAPQDVEAPSVSDSSHHVNFEFNQRRGTVFGGDSVIVTFNVRTTDPGRQLHRIVVRNLQTREDFKCIVLLNSVQPRYLHFPSLNSVKDEREVDLGLCYVDSGKLYAKVAEIPIESHSQDPLYLSSSSNLVKQVFVFADPTLTTPLTDILIPPNGKLVVYLCLQPSVPFETLQQGQCRQLTGGIRFDLYTAPSSVNTVLDSSLPPNNSPSLTSTQTDANQASVTVPKRARLQKEVVKFTAMVGQALLNVTKPSMLPVNFPYQPGAWYKGSLMLSNKCSRLPLYYAIDCMSLIRVNSKEGRLEAVEVDATRSRCTIEFEFFVQSFGLCQETLIVRNVSSPSQTISLPISLFIDDPSLSLIDFTPAPPQSDSTNRIEGSIDILFDEIYVSEQPGSSPVERWLIEPQYRVLQLCNNSDDSVRVTPKSTLATSAIWEVPDDWLDASPPAVAVQNATVSQQVASLCGESILLPAKAKATLKLSNPRPSNEFILEQQASLQAGRVVTTEALFLLHVARTSWAHRPPRISKLFLLTCKFCTSIGDLQPPIMDLGRVGYCNAWQNVPFVLTLRNTASISLHFQLPELPPFLTFPSLSKSEQATSPLTLILPSFGTQELHGILFTKEVHLHGRLYASPRLGPTAVNASREPSSDNLATSNSFVGPLSHVLTLTNIHNINNKLLAELRATVTAYELRLLRLELEGHILLPPLSFPSELNSSLCSQWFILENVAEEPVAVEIFVELQPLLSSFLVVEVLSRTSNTPVLHSVVLQPDEEFEVRLNVTIRGLTRPSLAASLLFANAQQSSVVLGNIVLQTPHPNPTAAAAALNDPSASLDHGRDNNLQMLPHPVTGGLVVRRVVPLRGMLVESPIFSVSPLQIEFEITIDNSGTDSDNDDESDIASSHQGSVGVSGSTNEFRERSISSGSGISAWIEHTASLDIGAETEATGGVFSPPSPMSPLPSRRASINGTDLANLEHCLAEIDSSSVSAFPVDSSTTPSRRIEPEILTIHNASMFEITIEVVVEGSSSLKPGVIQVHPLDEKQCIVVAAQSEANLTVNLNLMNVSSTTSLEDVVIRLRDVESAVSVCSVAVSLTMVNNSGLRHDHVQPLRQSIRASQQLQNPAQQKINDLIVAPRTSPSSSNASTPFHPPPFSSESSASSIDQGLTAASSSSTANVASSVPSTTSISTLTSPLIAGSVDTNSSAPLSAIPANLLAASSSSAAIIQTGAGGNNIGMLRPKVTSSASDEASSSHGEAPNSMPRIILKNCPRLPSIGHSASFLFNGMVQESLLQKTSGTPTYAQAASGLNSPNQFPSRVFSSSGTGVQAERYELALGYRNASTTPIVCELVLSNPSAVIVDFRITTLRDNDKSWLVMSRTEGTLLPGSGKAKSDKESSSASIFLTFLPSKPDLYSTYLLLENIQNPLDLKSIRVSMEVVASLGASTRRSSLVDLVMFDVLVACVPAIPTPAITATQQDMAVSLDFGLIHFGQVYQDRSFIIFNYALITLEFSIASNLGLDDPSDLAFSLSRSNSKLFRSLSVAPSSSVRVFIHFKPLSRRGNDTMASEEKLVEVYVSCRLLKDYQKVIQLKAQCVPRSMYIAANAATFFATVVTAEEMPTFPALHDPMILRVSTSPDNVKIPLTIRSVGPVNILLLNDTRLFTVNLISTAPALTDQASEQQNNDKNELTLVIGLNRDNLNKLLLQLRKEKFIEEHLTIYNTSNSRERIYISLRLSFGQLGEFYVASGGRATSAFNVLEEQILALLRDTRSPNVLWQQSSNMINDAVIGEGHVNILNPTDMSLHLRYMYIVDELVYFCLREVASEPFRQLAVMLFKTLLQQPAFLDYSETTSSQDNSSVEDNAWSILYDKWARPLSSFLSFFPGAHSDFDVLIELNARLIDAFRQTRRKTF